LINSFLEEFFFRGFVFLNVYETGNKGWAYLFSALLFALYHIAIFATWFNIPLMLLALFGLMVIGFVFNYLDTLSNNFLNSYLVHIFANLAIVLIGLALFGIL
jgi:membrane protease YdiL (CAAX protease family)